MNQVKKLLNFKYIEVKKYAQEKNPNSHQPNSGQFQKGHSLTQKRHNNGDIFGFQKGHKINAGRDEEKSPNWRGDKTKKRAMHEWVVKWKGQPTTCEKCGRTNLKGCQIHWANVDHKYRRVLDDYIRFCAKCHKEYDAIHNSLNKKT